METKVNLTVVGAFVLVLGAAGIAAVLWLGSGRLSAEGSTGPTWPTSPSRSRASTSTRR